MRRVRAARLPRDQPRLRRARRRSTSSCASAAASACRSAGTARSCARGTGVRHRERRMSVTTVMLVGVGGQGTILAADVLAKVAAASGLDVKLAEVHGMSQRGGSVDTVVRFGEHVFSPTIDPGAADHLVSFELIEAARWLHWLKPEGRLVVNNRIIAPLPVLIGEWATPDGPRGRARLRGRRLPRRRGARLRGRLTAQRQHRAHGRPLRRAALRGGRLARRHRAPRPAQDRRGQPGRVRARPEGLRGRGVRTVSKVRSAFRVHRERVRSRVRGDATCSATGGVNIRGFSVSDTADYGILRLVVDKPDRGARASHGRRVHGQGDRGHLHRAAGPAGRARERAEDRLRRRCEHRVRVLADRHLRRAERGGRRTARSRCSRTSPSRLVSQEEIASI